MTLLQLITLARSRLSDNLQPYQWETSELTDYVNRAVSEAAVRARLIIDSTTEDCCVIDVVANTAEYALNPAIFEIKRVFDVTHGNPLLRLNRANLDGLLQNWQAMTGQPTHYLVDLDAGISNNLVLYPKPTENAELRLTVYRTPLAVLADDDEVPEIPDLYHADLLHWVCHLAYLKENAETFNTDKALDYEAKFGAVFGLKQSAELIEFRRKRGVIRVSNHYF